MKAVQHVRRYRRSAGRAAGPRRADPSASDRAQLRPGRGRPVFTEYVAPVRLELIRKAYSALPPGGSLLVYDAMVDNKSRYRSMGLLSSLNIMLETREGFEASTDEYVRWLGDADFRDVTVTHLVGPTSMVYGFKPTA
ncbi:methyltransferase [Mycobacterium sp. LTG2003]